MEFPLKLISETVARQAAPEFVRVPLPIEARHLSLKIFNWAIWLRVQDRSPENKVGGRCAGSVECAGDGKTTAYRGAK
jgi:hypothetical protein